MADDIHISGTVCGVLRALRKTRHGKGFRKASWYSDSDRTETHTHLPAAVRIEWSLFRTTSEQVELVLVMFSLHVERQQTTAVRHRLDRSIVIHWSIVFIILQQGDNIRPCPWHNGSWQIWTKSTHLGCSNKEDEKREEKVEAERRIDGIPSVLPRFTREVRIWRALF